MRLGNYCELMFINTKGWGRKKSGAGSKNENPIHVYELYLFVTRCGRLLTRKRKKMRHNSRHGFQKCSSLKKQ